MTHRCLNELIALIKPKYPFLKNDAKTLLETPRNMNGTVKLNNGELVYFGMTSNLIKQLTTLPEKDFTECHKLSLHINVDGIPIYKSSAIEFWPILLHCKTFKNHINVIAIFCGTGKPNPLETFLKPFINEIKILTNE